MSGRAKRRAIVIGGVLAALGGVAGAETLRAGVPVEALTPDGMTRTEVVAPAAAGQPVRLVFAGENGQPAMWMDVLVADSAAEARTALRRAARGVSRSDAVAKRDDLGDVAFGHGTLVGFTQDNILIVVHAVADGVDAEAEAETALRVVQAADEGTPRAKGMILTSSLALAGKQSSVVDVRVKAALVAARLVAPGATAVLPLGQGHWRVTTTSPKTVSVLAVDPLLRVMSP